MPNVQHVLSKTAIWVAAARAVGAREPDSRARNPDHLAEALLGDPAQLVVRHPMIDALSQPYDMVMQDYEVSGMVRSMTIRTRFIEEALRRAIAAGAVQVLVIGAGLDSTACRHRQWLADVRVFELDRPATLQYKQQRVAAAVGAPPANLVFVPADLEHETLATALSRQGYDPALRTFVIMEGVSMYVPAEVLRATLRFVAAHAPGSRIVFDFCTQAMIEGLQRINVQALPPAARPAMERFAELIRDEPWVFGIRLDEERAFLADVGLELREMLTIGSPESVSRYLTRADGTVIGAESAARAESMRQAALARAAQAMTPGQREKVEAMLREQARQNAYRIAEAEVAGS